MKITVTMSQRGSSQNFLFRYAPLRLRGMNDQPTINSRANISGSQMPFPQRLSRPPANPSIDETTTTVFEVNNSGPCDLLNSSLDNITNFCQRQELRNRDIQAQLELATAEIRNLKARLDTSAGEIEQLQHVNQKLRVQHYFYRLLEYLTTLLFNLEFTPTCRKGIAESRSTLRGSKEYFCRHCPDY